MNSYRALVFTAAILGQAPAEQPSGEELLQLALKQRQSITKATVTIHAVTEHQDGKDSSGKLRTYTSKYRTWLDGARLGNQKQPRGEVICFNCPKEGLLFEYRAPRDPTESAHFYLKTCKNPAASHMIDPRFVGLTGSYGPLSPFRIQSALAPKDRSKATAEKGKWQGHDCFIVRFERLEPNAQMAYTIVPSMDHSIVQVEFKGDGSSICESSMQRYGKPPVWFPKSTRYESKDKDGKVYWRETINLTDVTLNQPIPEERFTLAGLDIPVGTRCVNSTGKGRELTWDGKELVDNSPPNTVSKRVAKELDEQIAIAEKQVAIKRAHIAVAEAQSKKAITQVASMKLAVAAGKAAESRQEKQIKRLEELVIKNQASQAELDALRFQLETTRARRLADEAKMAEHEADVVVERARVEVANLEFEEAELRLKHLKTRLTP